jgi:hypothetical protein
VRNLSGYCAPVPADSVVNANVIAAFISITYYTFEGIQTGIGGSGLCREFRDTFRIDVLGFSENLGLIYQEFLELLPLV